MSPGDVSVIRGLTSPVIAHAITCHHCRQSPLCHCFTTCPTCHHCRNHRCLVTLDCHHLSPITAVALLSLSLQVTTCPQLWPITALPIISCVFFRFFFSGRTSMYTSLSFMVNQRGISEPIWPDFSLSLSFLSVHFGLYQSILTN